MIILAVRLSYLFKVLLRFHFGNEKIFRLNTARKIPATERIQRVLKTGLLIIRIKFKPKKKKKKKGKCPKIKLITCIIQNLLYRSNKILRPIGTS